MMSLVHMWIRWPHGNARAVFSDFSTRRTGFKKVHLQAQRLQDPCSRSAKTMQNMCVSTQKHFHMDGPCHVCEVKGFLLETEMNMNGNKMWDDELLKEQVQHTDQEALIPVVNGLFLYMSCVPACVSVVCWYFKAKQLHSLQSSREHPLWQ